jgi:hypothetical protein
LSFIAGRGTPSNPLTQNEPLDRPPDGRRVEKSLGDGRDTQPANGRDLACPASNTQGLVVAALRGRLHLDDTSDGNEAVDGSGGGVAQRRTFARGEEGRHPALLGRWAERSVHVDAVMHRVEEAPVPPSRLGHPVHAARPQLCGLDAAPL